MKKEIVVIEEAVEEVVEEVAEEVVEEVVEIKAPIQIGEAVSCTADIAELTVLLNLTARQMVKLLNKGIIRGVCWNKEANGDISRIRRYMAEFMVCGFTTYTTTA